MRFSEPSIVTGLSALVDAGVTTVAAIILSPQYSPLLMSGYARRSTRRPGGDGRRAPEVIVAGAWHDSRPSSRRSRVACRAPSTGCPPRSARAPAS